MATLVDSTKQPRSIRSLAQLLFPAKVRNKRVRGNQSTIRRAHVDYTFTYFNDELKVLRLAGRTYDVTQYAQRLADYLGLVIKVVTCNDISNPLLRAQMAYYGIGGGLFYEPGAKTAWIVVPSSLDMKAQVLVVYHELAHIAAGHPLKPPQLLHEGAAEQHVAEAFPGHFVKRSDDLCEPTRRLARRRTPDTGDSQNTLAQCELEADLRARYAFKAGLYGEHIYYRDEFFFAFKDRTSFFPVGWPLSVIRKGRLKV